jgi:hypothetical protein
MAAMGACIWALAHQHCVLQRAAMTVVERFAVRREILTASHLCIAMDAAATARERV